MSIIRKIEGKVAIVTGASRGLGRAMAVALAEAGAELILASRNLEALKLTEAIIVQKGGKAHSIVVDVRSAVSVEQMVEESKRICGRIDILVNNAGIHPALHRAEKGTVEEWDDVVNTDLRGAYLCSLFVGRHMIERREGVIINISSIGGQVGVPGVSVPYCCAKAGVIAMTKSLAIEWAAYGIRVCSLIPGWTETEMNLEVREKKGPYYQFVIDRTPMKRFAKPEEISAVVVFLASDAASFITGSTISADGGWLAW